MGKEQIKVAMWTLEFYNFDTLSETAIAARKILIAANRAPNISDEIIRRKNLAEFKRKLLTVEGNKPSGPPIFLFLTMDSLMSVISIGKSEYNPTAPYIIGVYGKDLTIKIYNNER